ncbi:MULTISPECIES: hypothetical protein [Paraburkholderia]|jgi:hypothetical protein|uniref:hypothetical protein n=1 Tax=Paraburkholderia TaxID=1822464 RepID=UPI0038BAAFF4
MFRMIVGRFEIVATSGVENGSAPVGKSEAQAYDVIDRRSTGLTTTAKRGVELDDAWFYCVRLQGRARGIALLH